MLDVPTQYSEGGPRSSRMKAQWPMTWNFKKDVLHHTTVNKSEDPDGTAGQRRSQLLVPGKGGVLRYGTMVTTDDSVGKRDVLFPE